MANEYVKISALPEGTTLVAGDYLVYVDNSGTPTTKKIEEVNAAFALGISGYSGYSGLGLSGASGYSGFSGVGTSGYSGYSGAGLSGFSGYSGLDGAASASGYSGFSGKSGYSGFSSVSGYSGFSGAGGSSTFAGGQFELYRLLAVNSNPGATTTTPIGVGAISPAGDASANADGANGVFIRRDTAATTTTTAGFDWNISNFARTAYLPQIFTKLQTVASIAVCRIWVGIFSATPVNSNDPAINGLGFRYSTSVPDTNWQAWSNDGSGGGTITDTGVPVATTTCYLFAIKVVSTASVEFYISTNLGVTYTLVATHATNLPASTQPMNYHFWIETLENVAKQLSHAWTYVRQY